MMHNLRSTSRISRLLWLALGAAAGFGLLTVWLGLAVLGRSRAGSAAPAPFVTVIPNPTSTPVPTPSPTLPPQTSESATPGGSNPSGAGLQTGTLVAVSGTEGGGLRLRSLPGVEASVNLIALESEVFEIREGPVEVGGRTWWYLVNPYDSSKFGWGASEYLVPADSP